jgi:hypothetical protein
MKLLLTLGIFSTLLTGATLVKAHEGHVHDIPQSIEAPKGGTIKAVEEVYVEVVSRGAEIKIYIYDKSLKQQDLASYKLSAKAKFPRTKKITDIALKLNGNFAEAVFDAKGAHRYTLVLKIQEPGEDHADTLNFTIEPKK